jgi:hypothetical protein
VFAVEFYAAIGFEGEFQFFLYSLVMSVLSFPMCVKVAHFCFGALLLGFFFLSLISNQSTSYSMS